MAGMRRESPAAPDGAAGGPACAAAPAGAAAVPRPEPAREEGEAAPRQAQAGVPAGSSGGLEAALAEVGTAAREWGIRPDLMEGRFVSALMVAVREVGRVSQVAQAEMRDLFRRGQQTAEAEYQQARELSRAADAALAQARSVQLFLQADQENLVARMIKETLPLFAQNLKDVMVIREQRWNRDQSLRRYALGGAVLLSVFLAGYGLRTWADWGETGFAKRCLAHPLSSQNHVFCDVTTLAAADGH
jgi:hypothetical protein